ncbi:TPA: glycosyltransferase family 39 protein [Enterobacter asburiae]|nr:glycosyltransferase family 39 protein [Enterobacter asburiae]
MTSKFRPFPFFFAVLGMVLLSLLTYNINNSRFADWDESRHIVSALQMLQSGNYIVNKWGAAVDMWNLKPPVSFWSLVITSKIFGISLITMRIPSILSGMLLFAICAYFLNKRYNFIASLCFMLLFISCSKLITYHSFRSADPDAIYLLFIVLSVVILSFNCKTRNIAFAAFLVSLAFLTKSWHALSIGFAFITAYFYQVKDRNLNFKSFIFPIICVSIPVILWLIARYQYDKFDFIIKMIDYDLLHRSSVQIEGHITSKWYYLDILYENHFLLLIAFVSSLAISILSNGVKSTFSYDVNIILISILTLFAFFTLAQTRLSWYGYPHTLLMCYATAILIGKSKHSWVLVVLVILPGSIIQLNSIYREISTYRLPDMYYQLSMINKDGKGAIYTPQKISQSERAALMVYGGFSQEQIKISGHDSGYYLLKRSNDTFDGPKDKCMLISRGNEFNIHTCKD